jgi:hypothetical protein
MAQEQALFLQTEYAEILDQGRYCGVTKVRVPVSEWLA